MSAWAVHPRLLQHSPAFLVLFSLAVLVRWSPDLLALVLLTIRVHAVLASKYTSMEQRRTRRFQLELPLPSPAPGAERVACGFHEEHQFHAECCSPPDAEPDLGGSDRIHHHAQSRVARSRSICGAWARYLRSERMLGGPIGRVTRSPRLSSATSSFATQPIRGMSR